MVVSEDKKEALAGYYRMSGIPNGPWKRLYLAGLDACKKYRIENDSNIYGGDELMYAGMVIKKESLCASGGDYSSRLYYIREIE